MVEDERLDPDRRPRSRGGYGEAIPFAERWHLMEKAGRGFLDAVRRSMRQAREVVGAATIDLPGPERKDDRQTISGNLERSP